MFVKRVRFKSSAREGASFVVDTHGGGGARGNVVSKNRTLQIPLRHTPTHVVAPFYMPMPNSGTWAGYEVFGYPSDTPVLLVSTAGCPGDASPIRI